MSTPTPGDVLIVSRGDCHSVSIVPEAAPLSFKTLALVREFARRWVVLHPAASVWHQSGNTLRLMPLEVSSEP